MTDTIVIGNKSVFPVDEVRKALAEYDAKPKQGVIDWDRVIKEEYWCDFKGSPTSPLCTVLAQKLISKHDIATYPFKSSNGACWSRCYLARRPNIIQPHFGSDGLPEGVENSDNVTIYLRCGIIANSVDHQRSRSWEHEHVGGDIMAFIVHKPIGGS